MGDLGEAKRTLQKALLGYKDNFGPDSLNVHMANTLFNLDVRLFLQREADRSKRCFGECLGKATREFGRRLGEYRVNREDIGDCFAKTG